VPRDLTRDRVWADTYEVADRMSQRYDVHVRAIWRRRRALTVEQGLAVDTLTLFEVVRRRHLLSTRWEQVKPVAEAAANISAVIRRPDQSVPFADS